MQLSVMQWLLVVGEVTLKALILVVMIRGKFRSKYPFFFNFIAFTLLALVVQIALIPRISAVGYFYLYWGPMAVATLLSFGVMYEAFAGILKPYSALVDLGKLLFRWAFVFLAMASLLTALATNGDQSDKLCAAIQLLDRSCDLMQCGLLMLLVLFESRLGLSWRNPMVCIMAGFGANGALALAKSFVVNRVPAWTYGLEMVSAISALAIFAAWFASFVLPQPARQTAKDSPANLIFQRWNEALMATPLVARKNQAAFAPVESFLPGVEQTVERVLARKMMN